MRYCFHVAVESIGQTVQTARLPGMNMPPRLALSTVKLSRLFV
jgi:hypothetical protein